MNKMKKIKYWIIAVLLGLLLQIPGYAFDIHEYIHEFPFREHEIDAVIVEMDIFFGWEFEDKEGMKAGAEQAIKELTKIRTELDERSLPIELWPLKNAQIAIIDRCLDFYTGVEKKTSEDVKKESKEINKAFEDYEKEIKKIVTADIYKNWFPGKDYDPVEGEAEFFEDAGSRQAYKEAVRLLEERNFTEAYSRLKELKQKCAGKPGEACVNVRLGECLMHSDSDFMAGKVDVMDEGLKMLDEVMARQEYSPVLYDAFYRWRTAYQFYYCGSSNYSIIPNDMYNQKRLIVLNTLKRHIHDYPEDKWAKTQLFLLLDLPNIRRGTPYGNTNLNHYGILYTDLLDDEEQSEENLGVETEEN